MNLKTGVPQIDTLAAAGTLPVLMAGVTLGVTAMSLIYFFLRFMKNLHEFPEMKAIDSLIGLDFKAGRAPESYRWTKALKEASAKFSKPFLVNFTDMGRTLVLPSKYTEDVKNNKDMSATEGFAKDFPMDVPGFEPMKVGQKNMVFHDAVRIKLTQALTFFTDDLSDESKKALPEVFPASQDWQELTINKPLLDLVTRLSSLIFLGRDFEHIEEWREISATYTVNLFQCSRVIRKWNRRLWPYVHWFLPEFKALRAQVKRARQIIEPEVKARRLRRAQAEKDGTVARKSLDSVDWFEDVRNGVDFDIVSGELLLSLVAIHTTSSTLQNTLLDICANPDIIQPLRDEIRTVVQEDGGLQRTTLHKLKLMDSVLKESQRLHPLGQATLRRKTLNDVELHDGTVLRKGTYTMSTMDNLDEEVFKNPYKFDGYRFFNLRKQAGNENKWQFVTTTPELLGFGHGLHACPGRFFASNELKVALMHLLTNYDWKLPEGEERMESLELGIETPINPYARVLYKSREAEIEF